MTPTHPMDALTPAQRREINALPPLERARARLAQKKFEASRTKRRAAYAAVTGHPKSTLAAEVASINTELLSLALSDDGIETSAVVPEVAMNLARLQVRARALARGGPRSAPGSPVAPAVTPPGEHITPEAFRAKVNLRRRRDALIKTRGQAGARRKATSTTASATPETASPPPTPHRHARIWTLVGSVSPDGYGAVCPGPPHCGPHRLDQANPHAAARRQAMEREQQAKRRARHQPCASAPE